MDDENIKKAKQAASMALLQSKAKEFFYRRYAGFNTLVIRV